MNIRSFMRLKNKANKSMDLATKFAEYYNQSIILDNTILYECRDGKSMTDSPYAVFKYLLENQNYSEYKHIWVIDNNSEQWILMQQKYEKFKNVKFVLRDTDEYLQYLVSAKYLFNNSTFQSFFVPKKEQVCVNTWHGIPLKKMGYDIEKGNPAGLQNVVRNFFFADILVSPDSHTTNMFLNSFKLRDAYEGKIAEIGYPRIDLICLENKYKIYKRLIDLNLRIDQNKKTILYCPTWKGTNVNRPENELRQIISESEFLRQSVDDEYNLLIKVHPFIYSAAEKYEELAPYLIPDFMDPNEVMSCIDLLITDYSSIFFDFLKTDKPIIFYCWDKEMYEGNRGLYMAEEDLPGPVVTTIMQVAETIKNITFTEQAFKENYLKNKQKFIPYEDGCSTQRLVKFIFDEKQPELGKIHKPKNTDKKTLLIYAGGMKNNGITSSLVNLLKNLDYTRYDVTCFTGYPRAKDAIHNILSIPQEVRFIYKPGYAILTNKEQKLLRKFNKTSNKRNSIQIPWNGIKREANRIFSNRTFDIALDFSGYSFFWAKYIIASQSKKKICFLHSDMIADKNREVNGKKIHEKNLLALFYNYEKFDKLLTVSPIMQEVNQQQLKEFVSEEKIDYTLNTLDTNKLLNDPDISEDEGQIFTTKQIVLKCLVDEVRVYNQWNSTDFELKKIPVDARIVAIMQTTVKDDVRYKLVVNDIYLGWVSSLQFSKKFYQVLQKEKIRQYGYVKNDKKRFLWMDLPTHENARLVSKLHYYKYFMVEVTQRAELENGQVYFEIKRNNEILGWVEDAAISVVKNNILLRQIKNSMSNKKRQAHWQNRILETIIEEGFVYFKSEPKDDFWQQSIMNMNYDVPLSEYIGKPYKYSMKVLTNDGWYYKLWNDEKNIGWVSEKNIEKIENQQVIFTIPLLGRVHLNNKYVYTSIHCDKQIEVTQAEQNIVNRLVTVDGIFYQTADQYFIPEKDISSLEVFEDEEQSYLVEGTFNIVTMGRLSPEKRQDDLIKAFKKLENKYEDIRLYLLGDGPLFTDLRKLIQEEELADKVFLMGHQSNPFTFLKKAQLFVLTSYYEGQPMVLLEAMAIQVPVAATNIPATQYVLKNGENGLLAKSNSVDGIAEMLEEAYLTKLKPAKFDLYEYNENAVQMFYEKIEGDVK